MYAFEEWEKYGVKLNVQSIAPAVQVPPVTDTVSLFVPSVMRIWYCPHGPPNRVVPPVSTPVGPTEIVTVACTPAFNAVGMPLKDQLSLACTVRVRLNHFTSMPVSGGWVTVLCPFGLPGTSATWTASGCETGLSCASR